MSERALEKRDYKPGQIIFKQGDEGDEAYIIESGQIEIAKGNADAELVIATVDVGGLIGEMALIDNSPRMATARAMKKTTCIVIPKRAFKKLMRDANPVLQAVMNTMMQRLRGKASKSAKSTIG